jgi:hypothetical protein
MLGRLLAAIAGPLCFTRTPPGMGYSPGASNVGSVRMVNPSMSMRAVGPPIRVTFVILLS